VPTLILHGDGDQIVPIAVVAFLDRIQHVLKTQQLTE
jgi:pimeloyl-ACP methyl ester carboxylesterase